MRSTSSLYLCTLTLSDFISEGVAGEFQEAVVEGVVANFPAPVNKVGTGCNHYFRKSHSSLGRILGHDDLWHTCIGCSLYRNAAD